jgi:16S rRNA (cytidine1402-2'-O)-methyltransferase
MNGTLSLVSVPIGNPEDFTLRGVRTLKEADLIVYEEHREGKRILRLIGVEKPSIVLNEHEEKEGTEEAIAALVSGKNVALIADSGTPIFSDPGRMLVQRAIERGIRVVPVPGASSLMPSLIVSGFPIRQFVFRGFLSPKHDERLRELRMLKNERRTVVLMDTPYRLRALLEDVASVFGQVRRVCIAFDLTLPTEEIFHGTAPDLLAKVVKEEKKGEFVLLLAGEEQRSHKRLPR